MRTSVKRSTALFLQVVIVLIGIGAFVLLLWEPQVEGRNAHATNSEIYFKDPFLALVYLGSIAFFAALIQAFKLAGYAAQKKIFSHEAVRSLRTIKYCALTIICFVVVEEIIILLNHGNDDPAGGVFVGALIVFGSTIVTIAAARFERSFQNAVGRKPGNGLTA